MSEDKNQPQESIKFAAKKGEEFRLSGKTYTVESVKGNTIAYSDGEGSETATVDISEMHVSKKDDMFNVNKSAPAGTSFVVSRDDTKKRVEEAQTKEGLKDISNMTQLIKHYYAKNKKDLELSPKEFAEKYRIPNYIAVGKIRNQLLNG